MTKIKRILSEPPRDNTWLAYHAEMQSKYKTFVRFEDGRKPYYTDASFDEVRAAERGYFEVINCEWSAETWHESPYMRRVFDERITEIYRDETENDVGYREKSTWLLKNHRSDGISFMRDVESGYLYGYAGNAVINRLIDGTWLGGTTAKVVELNSAPVDELKRIARRLQAKHRRGFYDDDIDWIAEIAGFRRAEI